MKAVMDEIWLLKSLLKIQIRKNEKIAGNSKIKKKLLKKKT